MNYKIEYIRKACKLNGLTVEEIMDELEIPYSKDILNQDLGEVYFNPSEKVKISNKLNTIVPYFYGIIDDKELFKGNLTIEKYNNSKKLFKIEDYVKSIGMGSYIYDIFDPTRENYLSESYLDNLIREMYQKPYDLVENLSKIEEYYYHYVKTNPLHINSLQSACEPIKISAVSQCGEMLRYIENQTEEIAYRAVLNQGTALEYVTPKLHTEKVVKSALKQNPLSFRFSQLKTYDICMHAVQCDGINLQFVPNELRDHSMIFAALNSNGWAIRYVDHQTEEYALAAVLQNTESCLFVDEDIRNNNVCVKAIYNEVVKKHSFLNV